MNKNMLIVAAALMVAGGVLWYSKASSPVVQTPPVLTDTVLPGSATGTLPGDEETAGFAKIGANAMYVAEQRPGNELVIGLLSLESPGYVAIHESVDGRAGAIIGVTELMGSGTHKKVKVTLSRGALDGEELVAMLHKEKNTTGFNSGDDAPVRDADENIISMSFQVSASASDPAIVEMEF